LVILVFELRPLCVVRKLFYHLSMTPILFDCYFEDRVSLFAQAGLNCILQ
jgi:hypothetical protein